MIHIGITIFLQYEQLDGKLNALKGLSSIALSFSENLQMRSFVLNEICLKGKKEFLKGLNFVVQTFNGKIENFGKAFINIIRLFLYAEKEQIKVFFLFF